MTITNFTFADVSGTLEATLLLPIFLFVPGFVLGWAGNVLAFRRRRLITQLALSTPLSIALCPIATFLMAYFLPLGLVWTFYVGAVLAFVTILGRKLRKKNPLGLVAGEGRYVRYIGLFAVGWVVVAVASLVDLQIGHRLYMSVAAFDYSVRTAFTAAATRAIPPANPFFAANPPIPLRYHYFWMVVCSLPARLVGLSPRYALFGGTVWCGFGLMSLIAMGVKFLSDSQENLARRITIGIALLSVTGLDLIPTLWLMRSKIVYGDMEWWNTQITSWADSLLWAPHHVAALIACVVGAIILWDDTGSPSLSCKLCTITVAGAAFASAAGMSVYVAFTFALFLLLWLVLSANRQQAISLIVLGLASLIFALPFLHLISEVGAGGKFISLSVRRFALLDSAFGGKATLGMYALALPLNYFLELGFFLVVLLYRAWRTGSSRLMQPREAACWGMVTTSFLVGSLLRSGTIVNNDLAFRCFLPAQFVLLLWGAVMLDEWSGRPATTVGSKVARWAATACLVLGLLGTTYQLAMLRVFPIVAEHYADLVLVPHWMVPIRNIGARTYALRTAYESLEPRLRPGAIIQHNPETADYLGHLLYSRNDKLVGIPMCGTVFGGDPKLCRNRADDLAKLFDVPNQRETYDLSDVCRDLSVNVILVKDTDPVWNRRGSWVWHDRPMYANDYVRAFHCPIAQAATP